MLITARSPVTRILTLVGLSCVALLAVALSAAASAQTLAATRDPTPGRVWIERLERPDRIPGLRINDVVACLGLKPGDVVADIGAGTGAFSIPFARAVAPTGRVLAQDIWPDLLDYIGDKARAQQIDNLEPVLGRGDDPMLPPGQIDVVFFHDVFHNVLDRQGYLGIVASALKPGGRIAIIEQEFDDPIAKRWDENTNRITADQVDAWMAAIGFRRLETFDTFQGENNPPGTGMPERWFVVYGRPADGEA